MLDMKKLRTNARTVPNRANFVARARAAMGSMPNRVAGATPSAIGASMAPTQSGTPRFTGQPMRSTDFQGKAPMSPKRSTVMQGQAPRP